MKSDKTSDATGKYPFQLVAIDMDGTLLRPDSTVGNRTRHVLASLLSKGIHVIFATGRPYTNVFRVKQKLNIFESDTETLSALGEGRRRPRSLSITSNGACIYDERNVNVYQECIHPSTCKTLYSLFHDDPDVNLSIFRSVGPEERHSQGYVNVSDIGTAEEERAVDEWVCRRPAEKEAELYRATQFQYRIEEDTEKFPTSNVNEIFFLCYDKEKNAAAEKELRMQLEKMNQESGGDRTKRLRLAPSSEYCLDVILYDVSKASSLAAILQQLDLSFDDVVAFGDGMNDLEMLSTVKKGYVMENASDRVKKILIRRDEEEILQTEGEYYRDICKKAQACEVIGRNDDEAVATKLAELFEIDLSGVPN